ncbi:MAG: hypothetical protein K6F83_03815 [Clostridiales bacterium]|nr:hypothetical protein [Clostridiales bacterium]
MSILKKQNVNDAIAERVKKLLDDSKYRTISTIVITEEEAAVPTIRYNITEVIIPEEE